MKHKEILAKVKQVKNTSPLRREPPYREKVAAAYGRLESPKYLMTRSDGLGHLNSAPAQLVHDPKDRWRFFK